MCRVPVVSLSISASTSSHRRGADLEHPAVGHRIATVCGEVQQYPFDLHGFCIDQPADRIETHDDANRDQFASNAKGAVDGAVSINGWVGCGDQPKRLSSN